MTKKRKDRPEHFLREWREYREITQEDLAAKIGTNSSVISLLESGNRRLSDKWLRKLAPALGTMPGAILDYDPNSVDGAIIDLWASIPKELKGQARAVLETFRKKSA